jgi:DNA-binding MarR family transcriptional regulator
MVQHDAAGELNREQAEESERAEEFLRAFDALAQAVRRARGAPATGDAVTLSQYALLQGLRDRDEARVVDLANAAGVTAPTATRILDALERRGVVRRRRARDDRRAVTVTLTTRGQELLAAHDAWMRVRQETFYAALPAGERVVAADLLIRLAKLIDELAAGPS